jgi:ABC-2 type transport system permease protein
MKTFLTLLGREVKSFFYSPIAYVVLFYFLLLSGFNFYSQISLMNNFPTEITVVEAFFMPALFWFPFILCFPLITMRTYSEEFRMGTIESLTTAPVTDWQVVAAKFFGVLVFYVILWAPTFASFSIFQYISGKTAANAAGAYWGAYLLLFMMGCFYIALGCLASSLTKDQINAATISFTTITLLLFIGFLPDIMNITAPAIKNSFAYVSAIQHMQDYSKGIIDSRPIVWYGSMTIFVGYLTLQVFQGRKWDEGNGVFAIVLVIFGVIASFASFYVMQHWTTSEKLALPIAIAVGIVFIGFGYRLLLGIKGHRLQIGLNTLLQVVIVAAIVLMVNYLSFRHFKRWDFSRNQKYALSSQTRTLLQSLKDPVKAVVFFSNATEIQPDVIALLREYEYASHGKFQMEVVDPYRNMTRAQELSQKYKFGNNDNIVILDYGNGKKTKFVNAIDMADYDQPDQMSMMMGQAQPRLKDFKGEQAITSSLVELTTGKPNKVYWINGHGEPDLKSQDFKTFTDYLKRENVQWEALNLLNTSTIPEDARGLIICGPKYDFSELEIKLINEFWEKKGRLFILLNPFARTPNLTAWLNTTGVMPQEDHVIGLGNFLGADENGNPKITKGVIKEAGFIILDSHTKITKDLEGASKRLFGTTESLAIDQARETMAKDRIIPLLQSVQGFWGETDLTSDDSKATFDSKTDHAGPLSLAVAVEKGGVEDNRVKLDTSRMIVVGNAELLNANALRISEGLNIDFAMNGINWLLDREELAGIPPKEKTNVVFSLDDKQLGRIWLGVITIPAFVALLGLTVWWRRRA